MVAHATPHNRYNTRQGIHARRKETRVLTNIVHHDILDLFNLAMHLSDPVNIRVGRVVFLQVRRGEGVKQNGSKKEANHVVQK